MTQKAEGDLSRERDFYRALLELSKLTDLQALLVEVSKLVEARTGAREAYVEVVGDDGAMDRSHVATVGCADARASEIKALVSRGILGEAVATGRTVVTADARADPRFSDLESVQSQGVEAVLCVPIGADPPVGAIYVQGRAGTQAFSPFSQTAIDDVELIASSIAPKVERLLRRAGLGSRPPRRLEPVEPAFADFVGRSQAMREVVERLRLAGPLDIHLLLMGPSGSGKTALARAAHLASKRKSAPFIELNCAAIPETLLESELFGADPGAYSSVPRGGVKGKVEAAEGGTLFLDEIAELSVASQAKLLQLLQDKRYFRLGSTTQRQADVRIIAATHVDLAVAVAERRFRQDLYFRLKVLEVKVPSLAERSEDIVPLSLHFLEQASRRHGWQGKAFAPSALRQLAAMEWNGHVRELANRVESALVNAVLRDSHVVERRDLLPTTAGADGREALTLQEATRTFQAKHVRSVLDSTDWNALEAAQILDISRSHVYNLIRAFDLQRD
jgi:Nif-specific regulatory protein